MKPRGASWEIAALLAQLDYTSARLQQTIRKGADFTRQLETLSTLATLVRRSPEQLVLLCTVQELNLPEIPRMVDFAAKHGSGLILFNMVKEPDGSPWMDTRFEEIALLFTEAQEWARKCGIEIRVPDHIGSKPFALTSARPT